MGYQIIIQPNKKLALWSSITTSIVMWDATTDEVIDYMAEQERERIKDEVLRTVAKLRNGKRAYYQFTKSWSDAIQAMREQHGWEAVGEILDTMDREHPPE